MYKDVIKDLILHGEITDVEGITHKLFLGYFKF